MVIRREEAEQIMSQQLPKHQQLPKKGSLEWLLLSAFRAGEESVSTGMSYDTWRRSLVDWGACICEECGIGKPRWAAECPEHGDVRRLKREDMPQEFLEHFGIAQQTSEGEPRCGKRYFDKNGDPDYCSFFKGHAGSCW